MTSPVDGSSTSSKRRSLFSRSPLSAIHGSDKVSSQFSKPPPAKNSKKRWVPERKASPAHTPTSSIGDISVDEMVEQASPGPPARPTLSLRTSSGRPASLFGSLRSFRSIDEFDEPATAPADSSFPHFLEQWNEASESAAKLSKSVIHHGDVQTGNSIFRKRKEYLVLTETHLCKLKSQQKAAEIFSQIPATPSTNRGSMMYHTSRPSAGSIQDFQSVSLDTTVDRESSTPLRHVVAVYQLDDGAPSFGLEVDCLDDEYNHASAMVLRFTEQYERDSWLTQIRAAANATTLADPNPLSPSNHQIAARAVEGEGDYDPSNYAIFKVVQRVSKAGQRSSAEDLTKIASTVCFLAIGIHKIHIISLSKKTQGISTPILGPSSPQRSYGILNLVDLRLSPTDDTFEFTFRLPFQPSRTLHLASLAAHDIASRFQQVEELLRPDWESRPYTIHDPLKLRSDSAALPHNPTVNTDSFDRTLVGYCVAYTVRPENIRYLVTDDVEDGPKFELLPPAYSRRGGYSEYELLAILRALRYNESFVTISFASISLDVLNELHDGHGSEHLCMRTKRGTALRMGYEDACRDRLLVQELRALAITNKKLRRMDFTSSITRHPKNSEENDGVRDLGCGVAEALFPLCKIQITNIDWIILSGIELGETDLDYLVAAAVDKSCHFRALEMSNCGLTDRTVTLLLDTLRAQDNTLEALDISKNVARLSPSVFGPQLGIFGFLRRLNLAQLSRTSDADSLIPLDTIMAWRLEELTLSGTSVNAATLDVICRYLLSSKSDLLRELRLDHTFLSGKDIAMLMRAVARHPGGLPLLHVDLSQNQFEKDHQQLATALKDGLTPALLTLRLLEYEDEDNFCALIKALTKNTSITHLDISKASLPYGASNETCHALERLFASNTALEFLDISGETSRLEDSKLGVGINRAITGLRHNTSLRCLRIQSQNLGLRGAHVLADVIRTNETLVELHCEGNGIPLSGLMDVVGALESNTTLQLLLGVEDSRHDAYNLAESQITSGRDDAYRPSTAIKNMSLKSKFTSKVAAASRQRAPPSPISQQPPKAASEALEALDDLDKVWDKQIGKLHFCLYRNQCIASGVPVAMRVEDHIAVDAAPEADQSMTEPILRPIASRNASNMTIENILTNVDFDATPRDEKDLQLGSAAASSVSVGFQVTTNSPQLSPTLAPSSERGLLEEFKEAIDRGNPSSRSISRDGSSSRMLAAGS